MILEYIDFNGITYDLDNKRSIDICMAKYLKVIEQGQFKKTFIPKPFISVLKARKKYLN